MNDDRALIEAFCNGDDYAFVSLYNRHKDAVYGFCYKMLLDRAVAQDAVQETFLRVFENRERLDHVGAFRSWLFTIARNHCLNLLRKSRRQVPLEEPVREAAASVETPVAQMERSEQVELVHAYLAQLKPDYREVIVLREYQNLSYAEIAAVTRSTLSAVKSRLFKARRKLASFMKPVLQEQPPEAASSAAQKKGERVA